MYQLLCKHAPYKEVNKYNLKLKTKSWTTTSFQKSVSVKKYPT